MKDKQYLYNAYNGTSGEDENGELETYENWLEKQLLSRIERLEQLDLSPVSDTFVYIVETNKGVAYSYLLTYEKAQEEVKRLQPRFKKPMQINTQKVY